MRLDRKSMLLYAVTDRAWLNGRSLAGDVERALRGGITFLQLREKELDFDRFLAEAKELKELAKRYSVPFVINDSVEIAKAVDADGVHIGQSDGEAQIAREILGPDKIIGVSAGTTEQAIAAEKAGADYIGVGAYRSTDTKTDVHVLTRQDFEAISNSVSIPIVGIGGINKQNMPELKGLGLDGVALVSAIFASEDIEGACRELLALSRSIAR